MKPWRAFFLVVVVLVLASLSCITEEQETWLLDANERQRQGLPTSTVEKTP